MYYYNVLVIDFCNFRFSAMYRKLYARAVGSCCECSYRNVSVLYTDHYCVRDKTGASDAFLAFDWVPANPAYAAQHALPVERVCVRPEAVGGQSARVNAQTTAGGNARECVDDDACTREAFGLWLPFNIIVRRVVGSQKLVCRYKSSECR